MSHYQVNRNTYFSQPYRSLESNLRNTPLNIIIKYLKSQRFKLFINDLSLFLYLCVTRDCSGSLARTGKITFPA